MSCKPNEQRVLLLYLLVRYMKDNPRAEFNSPVIFNGTPIHNLNDIAESINKDIENILCGALLLPEEVYALINNYGEELGIFPGGLRPWINAQRVLMNDYKKILVDFYKKPLEERVFRKTLAGMLELVEAVNETPWMYWRQDKPVNRSKILEEIADALHFIAEVVVELGADGGELMSYFLAKNIINMLRQAGLADKHKKYRTFEEVKS